jgi:hypothetical protein
MCDRQLGKLRSGRCPFGARTRHEVPELERHATGGQRPQRLHPCRFGEKVKHPLCRQFPRGASRGRLPGGRCSPRAQPESSSVGRGAASGRPRELCSAPPQSRSGSSNSIGGEEASKWNVRGDRPRRSFARVLTANVLLRKGSQGPFGSLRPASSGDPRTRMNKRIGRKRSEAGRNGRKGSIQLDKLAVTGLVSLAGSSLVYRSSTARGRKRADASGERSCRNGGNPCSEASIAGTCGSGSPTGTVLKTGWATGPGPLHCQR